MKQHEVVKLRALPYPSYRKIGEEKRFLLECIDPFVVQRAIFALQVKIQVVLRVHDLLTWR
jgi:hypothetical protein